MRMIKLCLSYLLNRILIVILLHVYNLFDKIDKQNFYLF